MNKLAFFFQTIAIAVVTTAFVFALNQSAAPIETAGFSKRQSLSVEETPALLTFLDRLKPEQNNTAKTPETEKTSIASR